MTRFERCWVYILVILAAVSNLLVLARVRALLTLWNYCAGRAKGDDV